MQDDNFHVGEIIEGFDLAGSIHKAVLTPVDGLAPVQIGDGGDTVEAIVGTSGALSALAIDEQLAEVPLALAHRRDIGDPELPRVDGDRRPTLYVPPTA